MFLLMVKGKASTFATVLVSAGWQLRNKNIEGLNDNPYPNRTHQKRNSLVRKSCKRTLENGDKDAEV